MLLFPHLNDAEGLLQQGSMGRLAWKRVLGAKMLKLEKTKGCVGVLQGNSLLCHIPPRENGTG